MANKKISILDTAVLLLGTELIPIVQPVDDPKDNKKITINQLMELAPVQVGDNISIFTNDLGYSSLPVIDSTGIVKNAADPTKVVKFSASLLTAGTTRTFSMPDVDGNLMTGVGVRTITVGDTAPPAPILGDVWVDTIAPLTLASYGITDAWRTTGSTVVTAPTITGRPLFQPAADSAALRFGSWASDPTLTADGDVWYNSTNGSLKYRMSGVSYFPVMTSALSTNRVPFGAGNAPYRLQDSANLTYVNNIITIGASPSGGFWASNGGLSLSGLSPSANTINFGPSGLLDATSSNATITYRAGVPTLTSGSGNGHIFSVNSGLNMSSGTHSYTMMNFSFTVSTSGTYTGTLRGILYNPTLTGVVGLTHIAIQTSSGNILFASHASDTGTKLDVRGNSGGDILRLASSGNTQRVLVNDAGGVLIGSGAITASTSLDVRGMSSGNIFRLADNADSVKFLMLNTGQTTLTMPRDPTGGGESGKIGGFTMNMSGVKDSGLDTAKGIYFNASWSGGGAVNTGTYESFVVTSTTGGSNSNAKFKIGIFEGGVTWPHAIYFTNALSGGTGIKIHTGEMSTGTYPSAGMIDYNPSLSGSSAVHTGTSILRLRPTYNFTAAYLNTVRGIYYNPTLTSMIGVTHIAFENTSGELRFGGVTQDDNKTQILVKDASTNQVFWRDETTIGSTAYWKVAGTSTLTATTTIDQGSNALQFTNVDQFLIRGRSTSTIANLLIQDSGSNRLFMIDNAGRHTYGTTSNVRFFTSSDGTSNDINGEFMLYSNSSILSGPRIIFRSTNMTMTSANASEMVRIQASVTVASGTHEFMNLNINPTYNTTASYAGNVRGIYYNPTLTSMIGVTHIAFENTSGELRFGGVPQNDSATKVLAIDAGTNMVVWIDKGTLGGGGGSVPGENLELVSSDGAGGFQSAGTAILAAGGDLTLGLASSTGGTERQIKCDGNVSNLGLTFQVKGNGIFRFGNAGASITDVNFTAISFGADADISFTPKGTGKVKTSSDLNIGYSASAGATRTILADGSAVTVDINITPKGSSGEARLRSASGAGRVYTSDTGSGGTSPTGFVGLVETATNNQVANGLHAYHHSTHATIIPGIGTAISFATQTAVGNVEIGGYIQSVATSVTSGSEAFDFEFKNMVGGAAPTEVLKISSSGDITIGAGKVSASRNIIASGTTVGAGSGLHLTSQAASGGVSANGGDVVVNLGDGIAGGIPGHFQVNTNIGSAYTVNIQAKSGHNAGIMSLYNSSAVAVHNFDLTRYMIFGTNDVTGIYPHKFALGGEIGKLNASTAATFDITTTNGGSTNVHGQHLAIAAGNGYTTSGDGSGGNITVTTGAKRSAGAGSDGNLTLDARTAILNLNANSLVFGGGTGGANGGPSLVINKRTNNFIATNSNADTIAIFGKDSSDSNATLAIALEQSVEAIGTFTGSHKIKVFINGTEYWLQLDQVV